MLLPRIARTVHQVGLRRPCLRVSFQSPGSTFAGLRTGMHTYSSFPSAGRGAGWVTLYAKHVFGAGAIASIGLGISAFARPKISCEAPPRQEKAPRGPTSLNEHAPPPQSSVSVYELSFGAVTGICAGVFVKKGAKAVAWLLGGVFVLLQYLGSNSLVKVDWIKMSSRFENLFYTQDAKGGMKPPSVVSLWRWLVDFLTADFQPRASFIAGFALGLRIG